MNYTILIYLIAEILSIIFMYSAEKTKRKDKKIYILFLILSILPFAILFALRSKYVGKDYLAYSDAFEGIINNTLSERQEDWLPIGFRTICMALGWIFNNKYYVVFAIINITTLSILIKAVWDNSKHPTFSLFIMMSFCLHFQIFNQFRQMLAIAITFYAYKYLKNREMWKYFVFIVIAGLIHPTSLIMLPIYFLSNIKLTKTSCICYIVLMISIFLGFDFIKDLLADTYYGKMYFGSSFDVVETKAIFNLALRVIMLVGSLIFYKKVTELDTTNKYAYNLVVFCTILQVLAAKSYIFARLTTYLFVYYIILIPDIFEELLKIIKNKKINNLMYVLITVALIVYQLVYYFSSSGASAGGYEVYKTFINDCNKIGETIT